METGCLLALGCGTWCHFWEADELLSHPHPPVDVKHFDCTWLRAGEWDVFVFSRQSCCCTFRFFLSPCLGLLFGSLIDFKLVDEYQAEVRGKPDMPD